MDQTPPAASAPIHIARLGTFTSNEGASVTFTAADFAAVAAAYDPAVDQAPIVVGHPALDDPAYGWVASLAVEGDRLVAQPEHVEPAFAELVRERRFKNVSASFYPPDHPANPKPGGWYLKHVGFLGAHKPAIKGLKPAQFADPAGAVTVNFSADDGAAPTTVKEDPMSDVNFAEREEVLATRERELQQREAGLAQREEADRKKAAEARHAANVSFAEAKVAEAKLAPAGKVLVIGLLDQLDAAKPVSFGEAGEMAPADALRKLLDGASPLIDLGERGAKPAGETSYTSFAAPPGYEADPAQAELYARAKKIQADKPDLDWMECVQRAQAG